MPCFGDPNLGSRLLTGCFKQRQRWNAKSCHKPNAPRTVTSEGKNSRLNRWKVEYFPFFTSGVLITARNINAPIWMRKWTWCHFSLRAVKYSLLCYLLQQRTSVTESHLVQWIWWQFSNPGSIMDSTNCRTKIERPALANGRCSGGFFLTPIYIYRSPPTKIYLCHFLMVFTV